MMTQIVLTGGKDHGYKKSTKTSLMDVLTGKWLQKSSPDLNIARYGHSSLGLQDRTFVACGDGDNGWQNLNSVEMLRLGAESWELINIPEFTPRRNPVLCQLDQNHICIMGGKDFDY